MPPGLVLAIDQGTTNTKALLVARSGQPEFRSSSPVALIHAEGERVEQDPLALWESVSKAIADCVSFAAQAGASIEALAISNQRETAVAWDAETGKPISNAISWQCLALGRNLPAPCVACRFHSRQNRPSSFHSLERREMGMAAGK